MCAWIQAHPDSGICKQWPPNGPFFRRFCRIWTWSWPRATLGIAARYEELVDDAKLRESSKQALLTILGQQTVLERNPALARTDRFPYIDPLNHVQLELLKRYWAGDTDERVVQAIHLIINAIAAGLRKSR